MNNTKRSLLVLGVITCLMVSSLCLPVNASAESEAKKVNINTADLGELQTLPRIGPKVAQRIIDYRKTNGKFNKVEEIMKVKGIGEKIFQSIKNMITVT